MTTSTSTSTVIVTGGTKGLGREISLAFARQGHCVLALYHQDESSAARLNSEFSAAGVPGRAIRHDVTDENESAPLWNLPEIRDAARLTLIHNACSAFEPQPFHLLAWSDFDQAMKVALKGAWISTRALLRQMVVSKQGCIVTVLSSAVRGTPPKGFAAYAAAKGALRTFTQSLAAEYSARGLKIFSVSPGFMETTLTADWNAGLKAGILSAAPATDPAQAAKRILELFDAPSTPGGGEDYPV